MLACGDIHDEAAVNLHHVYRELSQVVDRGKSGSEVVDGNPYADILKLVDLPGGLFRILQKTILGNLYLQVLRVDSPIFYDSPDRIDQIVIIELSW